MPDCGAAQTSRHTTESVLQLPLEWGTRHLTGKPVPVFGHPHSRETSPNAWSEPPQAQLCADPHIPSAASSRGWCLSLHSHPQEAAEVASWPSSLQETTQVPSGLCPHSGDQGCQSPEPFFWLQALKDHQRCPLGTGSRAALPSSQILLCVLDPFQTCLGNYRYRHSYAHCYRHVCIMCI